MLVTCRKGISVSSLGAQGSHATETQSSERMNSHYFMNQILQKEGQSDLISSGKC